MNRYVLLLLILASSCSAFTKKKSERTLARVFDDYLYESDLKGVIAPGTPSRDSLVISRNYIENWIRQRLVIHQARKNLSDRDLDFTAQLEDYKNSLTIYAYENALVRQNLDTLVTDEDIQNYYETNQQNFLLKDNIVRIQYVKFPAGSQAVKKARKLLSSDQPEDKNSLAELCENNSADYFLDDENWTLFNDVLMQIPIKTYNQEDFLRNNRYVEYQDSLYIYLVRFRDFKIKESVSPLNFERQRIRDIILNKRKAELISKMQEDIFISAQKKNDFEIY